MQILENRRVAVLGMAVLIVLAAFFGVSNALSPLRKSAQQAFVDGTTGISKDLDDRIAAAYNLTVVAGRYLDGSDPALAGVLSAREELIAAKSVSEKYRANIRLTDAVSALYEKLGTLPLSEQDAKYRRSLDADLRSSNEIISHSAYNRLAAEYNEALSAFPASALGRLIGYRALELFA